MQKLSINIALTTVTFNCVSGLSTTHSKEKKGLSTGALVHKTRKRRESLLDVIGLQSPRKPQLVSTVLEKSTIEVNWVPDVSDVIGDLGTPIRIYSMGLLTTICL
ncbi:hypothetical protein CEXT_616991 [Caerostris extrusa]|uniref:Uncharacterized protein n=1 Tax=Caerostris extrusa TaxID=172846 RepID=A0AAV4RNB6_CAEEX|nr:hypothetical protein CEXT_616991 [Caerostris extrusa]